MATGYSRVVLAQLKVIPPMRMISVHAGRFDGSFPQPRATIL
jgi:hypothetical protein